MKSHAAGQDNKVRHLRKVHVHPFRIKPFVLDNHFYSQLIQKLELYECGCVCVSVCTIRGPGVNSAEMAPLTPELASQPCQSAVMAGRASRMGQTWIIKQHGVSTGVSPAGLHGPSSLCLLLTR